MRDDPDNNPTAQCLFDIADAVGYKIGKQAEEDPSIQRIVDLYEKHARQTVLQQERQGKLIHRLLLALVGVLLFLFIMLIIDMVSPTGGWVRS